jgi:hypothetical protein
MSDERRAPRSGAPAPADEERNHQLERVSRRSREIEQAE